MRKAIPFLLTVVLTVVCTAGIVRASSSPDPVRAVAVSPSRVLGVDMSLSGCNKDPDNASEWTKFAKCVTSNFTKVRIWARTLDACMQLFKIQERTDDIYGSNPDDHHTFEVSGGLSTTTGGTFSYFMGWRQRAGCPTS